MVVKPGKSGSWYKATRIRHHHSTDKSVHRVIVFTENSNGIKSELAIVQYRFDGECHRLKNKPHGNAHKDTTPFVRTKKTVLQKIANAVKQQPSNQRVLHTVEEENGGLLSQLPSDIQRNKRQVRYVRSKETPSSVDPILDIMNMKDTDDSFIQQIHVDNKTSTVILFNDGQLNDIKRFCAPDQEKQASILSCDMTFKLGDFWVVTTQYHNLQVFS